MKLTQVFTDQKPKQPLDFNDLSSLTRQLIETSEELSAMSDEVAKAKTIREFSSDLRKRALALATREHIDKESAAAADVKGRASVRYGEELEQLNQDLSRAEHTLSRHDALRIRWESLRSCLSCWKQVSGNI